MRFLSPPMLEGMWLDCMARVNAMAALLKKTMDFVTSRILHDCINAWRWIGLPECISNVDEGVRLMGSVCSSEHVCSSICSMYMQSNDLCVDFPSSLLCGVESFRGHLPGHP